MVSEKGFEAACAYLFSTGAGASISNREEMRAALEAYEQAREVPAMRFEVTEEEWRKILDRKHADTVSYFGSCGPVCVNRDDVNALLAQRQQPPQAEAYVVLKTKAGYFAIPDGMQHESEPNCERIHVLPGPRPDDSVLRSTPVRTAARARQPLGGADAQALEHAITMAERERDAALRDLAEAREQLAAERKAHEKTRAKLERVRTEYGEGLLRAQEATAEAREQLVDQDSELANAEAKLRALQAERDAALRELTEACEQLAEKEAELANACECRDEWEARAKGFEAQLATEQRAQTISSDAAQSLKKQLAALERDYANMVDRAELEEGKLQALRNTCTSVLDVLADTRWNPAGDIAAWQRTGDGQNHGLVVAAMESLRMALTAPAFIAAPAPDEVAIPAGPERLVGALQDRVHQECGATRAAKSVKTAPAGHVYASPSDHLRPNDRHAMHEEPAKPRDVLTTLSDDEYEAAPGLSDDAIRVALKHGREDTERVRGVRPAKPQVTLEALAKQAARHERALRHVILQLGKPSWSDVRATAASQALHTDHAEADKEKP